MYKKPSLVIEYYVYYVLLLRSCQRLKEPGSTSTCANFWFPFNNNMFNFITLTFFFFLFFFSFCSTKYYRVCYVLWYTFRLDFIIIYILVYSQPCMYSNVFSCYPFHFIVDLYYFCIFCFINYIVLLYCCC